MRIVHSKGFLKVVSHLSAQIQKKPDDLVAILAENPFHPLPHSKQLTGKLDQAYSFRITRDWRVIYVFETDDTIRLVTVGHRKEIYR
jgi:addiction module RelE/StbE family toxin